jgi:hypothetical protein
VEKAVAYLRQAGLRALARGANQEAVAHLDQALVALRRLPKTRESTELTIDIHIDIRNALLGGGYARIRDHLRKAEVLARSLGDQRRLGRITTFMVTQRLAAGDYDGAVRFGEEALALGRTFGDGSGGTEDVAKLLPPGAGTRRAAWHAPARRPLPFRPRQALSAHGGARGGARALDHRDNDVSRDGHAVLAGAGGGGDASGGIGVAHDLRGPQHLPE